MAPGITAVTDCPGWPNRTGCSTPTAGPLIAVKLHILSRKTLGGLATDLSGRCLRVSGGDPVPGLYAAGEVAGFGGGAA